mmetsp:Transcript_99675/g.282065  ORF Transcript_99675/g.282065 Transcript_99675/m.282065 type:complete len:185 (+) Transcript_99675:3-557(+)
MAEYAGTRPGTQRISRWGQAEAALKFLARHAIEKDPDGISLLFFDTKFTEHLNVRTTRQVDGLFAGNRPHGRTFLAEPLGRAMEPDTIGRAETVLVIIDGAASDPAEVVREITARTQKMCRPELLSISFIQVGFDELATTYLDALQGVLRGEGERYRFDIVDTMSAQEMRGRSFLEVVESSVEG